MSADFRAIADMVAADIVEGRLPPGAQLPTQRRFARTHGIAASTAARVYGDLTRRGLIVGEVGRGSFVKAGRERPEPALAEPGSAAVDLELNFPVLPGQATTLERSLRTLLRPNRLAHSLAPVAAGGTAAARHAAGIHLSRPEWVASPDRILFTGNGRQAIAAALAAVVPIGGRLGVEGQTYPVIKAIAARLGINLIALSTDDQGLSPDAVRSAHQANPLHALYLQPALHNPLGITMDPARLAALGKTLQTLDLVALEDSIYGFLHDQPPLAAFAPGHVILADSLSKRLTPGLTVGFAIPPSGLVDRVSASVRGGGWGAQHFALTAATAWMSDGTATGIENTKRADAQARQEVVRQQLSGFSVRADPRAYHCWWHLPQPWRADTFVAAAGRLGIAVTPAAAFAVGTGHAPNAIRIALGSPPLTILEQALQTLAHLAHSSPDDTTPE